MREKKKTTKRGKQRQTRTSAAVIIRPRMSYTGYDGQKEQHAAGLSSRQLRRNSLQQLKRDYVDEKKIERAIACGAIYTTATRRKDTAQLYIHSDIREGKYNEKKKKARDRSGPSTPGPLIIIIA